MFWGTHVLSLDVLTKVNMIQGQQDGPLNVTAAAILKKTQCAVRGLPHKSCLVLGSSNFCCQKRSVLTTNIVQYPGACRNFFLLLQVGDNFVKSVLLRGPKVPSACSVSGPYSTKDIQGRDFLPSIYLF